LVDQIHTSNPNTRKDKVITYSGTVGADVTGILSGRRAAEIFIASAK
jgi:hypothetical protein